MATQITWSGIGLRLLFAIVVVFLTFNPEGYSYYHWGIKQFLPLDPLKVVAGIVLLIGWIMFVRATLRSLGAVGLILVTALCAALLWMLIDWGWLSKENSKVLAYAVLFIVSFILATGMSWSHIRRRVSGQYDIDDVDEQD
jgi:hypothetical protein